jgi:hypothetical protein
MEGEYHFNSTPISLPGSTVSAYERLENRWSFGHNTRKTCYVGPCFSNHRIFKGTLPSTGKEIMSDTVKMNHHTTTIPELTPASKIMEASRHLDTVLNRYSKKAPKNR